MSTKHPWGHFGKDELSPGGIGFVGWRQFETFFMCAQFFATQNIFKMICLVDW